MNRFFVSCVGVLVVSAISLAMPGCGKGDGDDPSLAPRERGARLAKFLDKKPTQAQLLAKFPPTKYGYSVPFPGDPSRTGSTGWMPYNKESMKGNLTAPPNYREVSFLYLYEDETKSSNIEHSWRGDVDFAPDGTMKKWNDWYKDFPPSTEPAE